MGFHPHPVSWYGAGSFHSSPLKGEDITKDVILWERVRVRVKKGLIQSFPKERQSRY
jgi:hypothetical protein